jgi:hypothetical protein
MRCCRPERQPASAVINAIRAHFAEFGIVAPRGLLWRMNR